MKDYLLFQSSLLNVFYFLVYKKLSQVYRMPLYYCFIKNFFKLIQNKKCCYDVNL